MLSQEESMVPALFFNFRKALIPFLHDDTYTAMAKVAEQAQINGSKYQERKHIQKSIVVNGNIKTKVDDNSIVDNSISNDFDNKSDDVPMNKKIKLDSNNNNNCETGYCVPCYELVWK